jgi:hypothetical protein
VGSKRIEQREGELFMLKRINVDTLDSKIQEFFKGILIQDDTYLLESNGKPLLGLVSPKEIVAQRDFDV